MHKLFDLIWVIYFIVYLLVVSYITLGDKLLSFIEQDNHKQII